MSLVWFKIPAYTGYTSMSFNQARTNQNAFELIKEKTGLELTLTNTTGNSWTNYENNGISDTAHYQVDFKFPDMETAQTCLIGLITDLFTDDSQMPVCFVDVENHFFAIISPYWYMSRDNSKGYQYHHYVHNFIFSMVYEGSDGSLKSGATVQHNTYFYNHLNISSWNETSDETIDSFTIVPACWIRYGDTYGSFIKNMYVNYTRKFKPGQKIIDDSGDVFITLGDYLLYYNGKNE